MPDHPTDSNSVWSHCTNLLNYIVDLESPSPLPISNGHLHTNKINDYALGQWLYETMNERNTLTVRKVYKLVVYQVSCTVRNISISKVKQTKIQLPLKVSLTRQLATKYKWIYNFTYSNKSKELKVRSQW